MPNAETLQAAKLLNPGNIYEHHPPRSGIVLAITFNMIMSIIEMDFMEYFSR